MKWTRLGFLERMPDRDPMYDEEEEADEAGAELRDIDYGAISHVEPLHPRRFRRPGRGGH